MEILRVFLQYFFGFCLKYIQQQQMSCSELWSVVHLQMCNIFIYVLKSYTKCIVLTKTSNPKYFKQIIESCFRVNYMDVDMDIYKKCDIVNSLSSD